MTDEEIDLVISSDELKYRIMSISKKFNGIDKKDLLQAGYIGALKACRKYREEFNTNFYTYAYTWIFGEMYEYASNSRDIKLNKNYIKLKREIENARQLLAQKNKCLPTNRELSLFLEISESEIEEISLMCTTIISLDNESELLNENNLYSVLGKTYDYDTKLLIKDSLENLSDLEREVINMRYFKDYTQQEVAEYLGINQVKVSRVENNSKKKIKEYICA